MEWNLGENEVKMGWKCGENGAGCRTRMEQYTAIYSNTKQYKAFCKRRTMQNGHGNGTQMR